MPGWRHRTAPPRTRPQGHQPRGPGLVQVGKTGRPSRRPRRLAFKAMLGGVVSNFVCRGDVHPVRSLQRWRLGLIGDKSRIAPVTTTLRPGNRTRARILLASTACTLAFLVLAALISAQWSPLIELDHEWCSRAFAITVAQSVCEDPGARRRAWCGNGPPSRAHGRSGVGVPRRSQSRARSLAGNRPWRGRVVQHADGGSGAHVRAPRRPMSSPRARLCVSIGACTSGRRDLHSGNAGRRVASDQTAARCARIGAALVPVLVAARRVSPNLPPERTGRATSWGVGWWAARGSGAPSPL